MVGSNAYSKLPLQMGVFSKSAYMGTFFPFGGNWQTGCCAHLFPGFVVDIDLHKNVYLMDHSGLKYPT